MSEVVSVSVWVCVWSQEGLLLEHDSCVKMQSEISYV